MPLRRLPACHDETVDTSGVLDWLLAGDVAVAYVATRDLLGRDDGDLQSRIATEGIGAALLAARGPDGQWGRGFYQPKWTCSHYTLVQLGEIGLSPTNPLARESVKLVLDTKRACDGGLCPAGPESLSDACVTGLGLRYASWFGANEERLCSLLDFLLRERVMDGGFNRRHNHPGELVTHSSLHT